MPGQVGSCVGRIAAATCLVLCSFAKHLEATDECHVELGSLLGGPVALHTLHGKLHAHAIHARVEHAACVRKRLHMCSCLREKGNLSTHWVCLNMLKSVHVSAYVIYRSCILAVGAAKFLDGKMKAMIHGNYEDAEC